MALFFGQYLLGMGEIDDAQLDEAVELIDEVNLTFGSVAVREGHLTPAQVDQILEAQKSRDQHFGNLAIELGMLDERALDALLDVQRASHLYIGEALVRVGALNEPSLARGLDGFKVVRGALGATPPHVPAALREHALGSMVLELFERVCLRVARVPMRVVGITEWVGASSYDFSVSLTADCDTNAAGLELGIGLDRELATQIAEGMICYADEALSQAEIEDALGELLNHLIGTANASLPSFDSSIGLPAFESLPLGGYALVIETPDSEAVLVVNPN